MAEPPQPHSPAQTRASRTVYSVHKESRAVIGEGLWCYQNYECYEDRVPRWHPRGLVADLCMDNFLRLYDPRRIRSSAVERSTPSYLGTGTSHCSERTPTKMLNIILTERICTGFVTTISYNFGFPVFGSTEWSSPFCTLNITFSECVMVMLQAGLRIVKCKCEQDAGILRLWWNVQGPGPSKVAARCNGSSSDVSRVYNGEFSNDEAIGNNGSPSPSLEGYLRKRRTIA